MANQRQMDEMRNFWPEFRGLVQEEMDQKRNVNGSIEFSHRGYVMGSGDEAERVYKFLEKEYREGIKDDKKLNVEESLEDALRTLVLKMDPFPVKKIEERNYSYDIQIGDFEETKEYSASEAGDNLEKMARVALRRFPELLPGESIMGRELSRRLSEIRKTGYDVPAYSRLNKEEKWELLRNIRKELGSRLQREAPEVARDIQRQNKDQQDDTWRFR